MDIDQSLAWQEAWMVVSYRYLIPVNANALHPFKGRGLGGEVGVITLPLYNSAFQSTRGAFYV